MTTATVLITGNTYPVKDQIKALGGRWDADAKGWRVPADQADAARALVGGAGATKPASGSKKYGYRKYGNRDSGQPSRIQREYDRKHGYGWMSDDHID